MRVTCAKPASPLDGIAFFKNQSGKLGKGDFAAAGENISWVLTRMVVKMNRYPTCGDEIPDSHHAAGL